MMPLQSQIHLTILDIPRAQWDSIWPALTEGYDFYQAQQEAGLEGFEFVYLTVHAADTLVLVAPLFLAHFDMGLAMDDGGRKWLSKVQRFWPRCLVLKSLFCGSPVSEKGLVGLHADYLGDARLMRVFNDALCALARQCGAWMVVFKDFMDPDLQALAPLRSLAWFPVDSLPTASLAINFATMDEYLGQLGYGTRKDLRRKLRKTEKAGGLEIEAVTDISHCIDQAYRLYRQVRDANALHFETLTRPLFLNFSRCMPAQTVFFLYWLPAADGTERRLVGFNFCLQHEDRLVDKYIGMDYAVSRDLNLYFVSYLYNVQWCLDHGKTLYMLSQGGYPVKIQLGAQLIPLRTLTRMRHPLLNWIANRFA